MKFEAIKTFLFENQGTRQTVLRNGIWRAFALGFGKLVRLFVILIAARWLGPNEFGIYSYALSIASLVFIFSDWGINLLFTRDSQHEDPQAVFNTAISAKLIISGLSLVAACFLPFFISGLSIYAFLLVAVTLFISNIRELYVSAMIAKQRSELEGYASIIEGAANIILLFALLYGFRTSAGFAVFNLATVIVAVTTSVFLVRKHLGLRIYKPKSKTVSALLRSGFPLALFGIAGYLFFSADQLFIKHFLGTESVGYYALATRAIYAAMILPSLFVSVLFPVLSRLVTNRQRLSEVFYKSLGSLFVGGVIVAGLIVVLRQFILLAAPQFTLSLPIVSVLSWILVFMFPSVLLDNVLVALNKQKQDFFLTLGASILNVILNIIWIPKYGVLGAAYASILSQALNTIVTFVYAKSVLKKIQD